MNTSAIDRCLCGADAAYEDCCGLYHAGAQTAPTAAALMRSRFSAYAKHNKDYLLTTWDANTRPDDIDFSKERAQWYKLEIISCKKGGKTDNKGLIEFKAYYLLDDEEHVMHELSRFKKTGGRWLYLDGLVKSIGRVGGQTHQGKNTPCPCGSGKKFKRCCGKSS